MYPHDTYPHDMYPHDMYPHDMYPHDSHKPRLFGTERPKWPMATDGMRATGLDLVLILLELRPRWFTIHLFEKFLTYLNLRTQLNIILYSY
jgi:hypothetical protein